MEDRKEQYRQELEALNDEDLLGEEFLQGLLAERSDAAAEDCEEHSWENTEKVFSEDDIAGMRQDKIAELVDELEEQKEEIACLL